MSEREVYRFEREVVTLYCPNRDYNIEIYTPGDEENVKKLSTSDYSVCKLFFYKSAEKAREYAEKEIAKLVQEDYKQRLIAEGYPDGVYRDGRLMRLKYEPCAYEYHFCIELKPGEPLAYENLDKEKEFKYWEKKHYWICDLFEKKYAKLPYREGEPGPQYARLEVIKLED